MRYKCEQWINLLEPNGKYMCHLLYKSIAAFRIYGSCMTLSVNWYYFLEQLNQLIVVMVTCGALFEVRPKFLNI
jgi:hypothetical protein